jgi:membrane protein implicated in regulation of membrane protease activity
VGAGAVVAGVDWQSVNVAAAFIIGAVFATVATIRITRTVAEMLREQRRKDRDQDRKHDV